MWCASLFCGRVCRLLLAGFRVGAGSSQGGFKLPGIGFVPALSRAVDKHSMVGRVGGGSRHKGSIPGAIMETMLVRALAYLVPRANSGNVLTISLLAREIPANFTQAQGFGEFKSWVPLLPPSLIFFVGFPP